MRTDEAEIDPTEIKEFSYFCRKVHKPGGYVVILADFS